MEQIRQRRGSPAPPREGRFAVDMMEASGDKRRTSTPRRAAAVARSRRGCRHFCTVLLCVVLFIVTLAGYVGYVVAHNPKELDEQWEDVVSYVQWWWSTTRGVTPPCTYAGVRHYAWGGAVDDATSCDCWLRRCPPAPAAAIDASPQLPSRGAVTVSSRVGVAPTVEQLWQTCAAAHAPVARDAAANRIHVFEAPHGATASGIFANLRAPMCVQSGRVYVPLPPGASSVTSTFSLGAYESFYTNLTDGVLARAVKYHPLTTVPAAGVLLTVSGQTGNLHTLLHEGLRGWAALMKDGFGPSFGTEAETAAWRATPKQVLFLSHPSMDIPQETTHSSAVARRLANAFSTSTTSPFFSIAPISRTRAGEAAREPMYCFCGGFTVPSVGLMDAPPLSQSGYAYMRHVVNAHMGGAPLEAEAGAMARRAREVALTSNPLYTSAVLSAWPPAAARRPADAGYRPRMLWVGRKRPRIVDEPRFIAAAIKTGFDVYVDTRYTTSATAEEQFYLARNADVIVGFHGVALINAVWMDATARQGCRALVEFLPYAQAAQVTRLYGEPVVASGNAYVPVFPTDAEFVSTPAFNTEEKQAQVKRELMGEGTAGAVHAVVGHPAFTKHRGVYDANNFTLQLRELYEKLQKCL